MLEVKSLNLSYLKWYFDELKSQHLRLEDFAYEKQKMKDEVIKNIQSIGN